MTRNLEDEKVEISIVSPVYMAGGIIKKLVKEIIDACNLINKDYEIILVEDGSTDQSWSEIIRICESNPAVKGIKLSRNFGQHVAIRAGLNISKGNWVVVIDCDLQDNPYEIINLYKKSQEGYPIVRARRSNRKDNIYKRFSSKIFYKVFEYFTGVSQDSSIANFGIYRKDVIHSVNKMNDTDPFFPSQINWIGFPKYDLNVNHNIGFIKKSNYNFRKLLRLASNNILVFSDKPLRLTIKLGFFISFISFLLGIIYSFMAIFNIFSVSGFASIIITLFFSTGIIVFFIGIVGLYVGKIFEGSKHRPLYIIEDRKN